MRFSRTATDTPDTEIPSYVKGQSTIVLDQRLKPKKLYEVAFLHQCDDVLGKSHGVEVSFSNSRASVGISTAFQDVVRISRLHRDFPQFSTFSLNTGHLEHRDRSVLYFPTWCLNHIPIFHLGNLFPEPQARQCLTAF